MVIRTKNPISDDQTVWGPDAPHETGRDSKTSEEKDIQDQKRNLNNKTEEEKEKAKKIAEEGLEANKISSAESRRES